MQPSALDRQEVSVATWNTDQTEQITRPYTEGYSSTSSTYNYNYGGDLEVLVGILFRVTESHCYLDAREPTRKPGPVEYWYSGGACTLSRCICSPCSLLPTLIFIYDEYVSCLLFFGVHTSGHYVVYIESSHCMVKTRRENFTTRENKYSTLWLVYACMSITDGLSLASARLLYVAFGWTRLVGLCMYSTMPTLLHTTSVESSTLHDANKIGRECRIFPYCVLLVRPGIGREYLTLVCEACRQDCSTIIESFYTPACDRNPLWVISPANGFLLGNDSTADNAACSAVSWLLICRLGCMHRGNYR